MKILQYLGVAALALLIAVALAVLPNRIESRLLQQTRNTLIEHDLAWVEPSIDGQELTIRGTPPSYKEKQRAETVLRSIPGIRVIHSHLGEPASDDMPFSAPRVTQGHAFFPTSGASTDISNTSQVATASEAKPSTRENPATVSGSQPEGAPADPSGKASATELVPAKLSASKRCQMALQQAFKGETIHFRMNTSVVRPASRKLLQRLLRAIKQDCQHVNLTIAGYTDSLGPADVNLKLSEARAVAIRDFLVSKGVEKKRLSTVGYGESKPIADNNTRAGRIRNRRIEIYPGG